MRSLRNKLKKGLTEEEKISIINHTLAAIPGEREIYAQLYQRYIQVLRSTKNVNTAYGVLEHSGDITCNIPSEFSKEFQIACVAAGKPILTPTEFLKSEGIRRSRRTINAKMERTPAIFERYSDHSGSRVGGCTLGKTAKDEHYS